MKKLLMIAAMAMFATVACSEDKPNEEQPPVVGAPKATIVAAPSSVEVGKGGAFNVTLDKPATAEVVIKIANAGTDFLTVAATEIKIAVGATTGTAAFTAKAEGSAKVSFTANTAAELLTKDLTVTVSKDKPVGPIYDFPAFEWGTYSAIAKVVIGTTTIESSAVNSPEGENKALAGNDDFEIGFVNDNKTATIVPLTDGIAYTIYYNNFTANEAATEMAVALYIDWNNDGDFADANEQVKLETGIKANASKEISGTITIPADAAASSRVRALCYYTKGSAIEAGVGSSESGNLIDFTYSK